MIPSMCADVPRVTAPENCQNTFLGSAPPTSTIFAALGEKEVVAGLAVQTTDPASRRGTSYTKLRSHWNRRPW